MKKMTRIIPVFLVGLLFTAPSLAHAQAVAVGSPEWTSLITQLIDLLQQELQAILTAQDTPSTVATSTPTTTQTVVQSANMDATYSVAVKTEVGGEGSSCLYPNLAKEYNLGQCDVPSILDAGVVYFTVTGDYSKALLTYWPADISAEDLKEGLANPPAKNGVYTNGSIINPNMPVNPDWTFDSGKTYDWNIVFTNKAGETTTNTGTFTIPVYQYTR